MSKERQAYMAGFEAGLDAGWKAAKDDQHGHESFSIFSIDAEQAWQQYRCQDDTDWRAVFSWLFTK